MGRKLFGGENKSFTSVSRPLEALPNQKMASVGFCAIYFLHNLIFRGLQRSCSSRLPERPDIKCHGSIPGGIDTPSCGAAILWFKWLLGET